MKKADKVYKDFLVTAKYLLKELDYYGVNQFKRKVTENEWSIGQIYDHLINGTQTYHVKQIKLCLSRQNGNVKGGKTFKGTVFFALKSFPPFKFKGVTPNDYTPAQPPSPVQVKDDLYKFIKVMNNLAKEIDESPNQDYKTLNQSLGMLNALEWFKLIEMHFRHHLRQKHKLDKFVRSYLKENSEPIVPAPEGAAEENDEWLDF